MAIPYDSMSDEEILLKVRQEGDHGGSDYLMDKYKGLVKQKVRSLYLIGGDTDDLIQEGMIGLMKAVRSFNPEKESSLYHFAEICISRQIYTALKASQRKKHSPLNSYISIYATSEEDSGNGIALMDTLTEEGISPEDLIVGREANRQLYENLDQSLSPFERKVLHYFLEGMNYTQIADKLNKDQKSIDNALQRIKSKASLLMS